MRKHRVPMAVATDSNPGTSPMTSLLLALNMAATLFGLTVDECLAGATRNAARALGVAGETGTLEAGKWAISRYGTSSARPSSSIGSASIRCMRASGGDDDRRRSAPGEASLADWRAIWRGAAVAVDPSSRPPWPRAPRAVERILARGEPVYGINTGFGKLASVRIKPADLAELQRNIVLSHAAGVGETAPAQHAAHDGAEARQPRAGRLGRPTATIALFEAMLARGVTPVVPRKDRSARRAISRRSPIWRRR